ncbi:MAG: HmuY family protein [Rhodocyclaceae bacterium]
MTFDNLENTSMNLQRRLPLTLGGTLLALMLAACGGGGGDGDSGGASSSSASSSAASSSAASSSSSSQASSSTGTAAFTQSADWTFTLPASGTSLCYDFNAKAEVAGCTGTAWDLKVTSSGRTATLWTNSGTSGTGGGGAFGGPFDHTWTELLNWQNATTDPVSGVIPSTLYFKDSASGVFTGTNAIASTVFEYGVGGSNDHLLYPNYRTLLITTDTTSASNTGTTTAPVFALQVTGYYGGSTGTTSGYPSFRWVNRATGATGSATVNASSDWVYYDLVSGAVSSATGTWHIAFNRYNFKLNGGASGSGTVGGYVSHIFYHLIFIQSLQNT